MPAGTGVVRLSCGQPAKFCPKSNTYVPGAGFVTLFGTNSSTIRTGGASRATSLVARLGGGAIPASIQPTSEPSRRFAVAERSEPASSQPTGSRRAS